MRRRMLVMDYQVDLEVFRGPMDLLLYLVRRDEVDIRDIPIARIADQFKQYLEVLKLIDVEAAGEFLVMASTLMEIKSRMLLPRPESAPEEEADPRQELVRQLIEYQKFKEATSLLDAQAEQQSQRLGRVPVTPRAGPDPSKQPLRAVELWDLVSAFGRLMRETTAGQAETIEVDFTPVQVYMDGIVSRLERDASLAFSALFDPPHTRGRLVGLFLAVLELIKASRIRVTQDELFTDFRVSLCA
jgi:segregation and condensation protein A